ncbi:MAG: DUF1998 domain-containing protein, partial [bacterium]|nr:DUF1998 domain-containing protein [bacterium]
GYLKALYQQKDDEGRPGEGILDVLRRAHEALKTCRCRRLRADDRPDSDGCYRCIRAYHLQYRAGRISRERGIRLLEDLLRSGAKRKQASALSELKVTALYGSLLEKKFVDALRAFVENKEGIFEKALIRGAAGFRFMLPSSDRVWELELQPHLGKAHGVMVDSQPDFVLWCDDAGVRPLAIFTDGFEYHCHPHNVLASDFKKRRAILASGNFYVWNLTWADVTDGVTSELMACQEVV